MSSARRHQVRLTGWRAPKAQADELCARQGADLVVAVTHTDRDMDYTIVRSRLVDVLPYLLPGRGLGTPHGSAPEASTYDAADGVPLLEGPPARGGSPERARPGKRFLE